MAFFGSSRIYLDYASATPLDPLAAREMMRAAQVVGNPGAIHAEGVEASAELDAARERVARELGCKPRDVVFVSGGTEANNLALLGLARKLETKARTLSGTHWVVSSIEHPSVLECFAEIERLGGNVSHVAPDSRGIISPDAVRKHLKKETVCVSVGWANNEIGTVQPLAAIARALREHEHHTSQTCVHKSDLCGCRRAVVFHSDAGQGPLYLGTTVHSLGVDMLTLDSAKLYGPRGIGVLYLNNTVELSAITMGGAQERGLRPGTENVALAAGFAEALAVRSLSRDAEGKRVRALRDELAKLLTKELPDAVINGELKFCLPHMLNISLPNIQSEYVTLALDHRGIAISTKSACREGQERRSHVVEALGGEPWRSENTLRISLGDATQKKELQRFVDALKEILSNIK